jgi:hypothetical protein
MYHHVAKYFVLDFNRAACTIKKVKGKKELQYACAYNAVISDVYVIVLM